MLTIRSNKIRKCLRLSWKARRRTPAIFFMSIQKAILSNWSKWDLGPIAEAERQADRGHLVGRMAEAKALKIMILSSRRLWTQGTLKRISWITMTNRRCSKSQKFKNRMANYRLAINKICLNRDCKTQQGTAQLNKIMMTNKNKGKRHKGPRFWRRENILATLERASKMNKE